jgi:hypothetical protein
VIHAAVFIVLLVCLGVACTHTYAVPDISLARHQSADKIPIRVGLVLTQEFTEAKWEKHRLGDTFRIEVGPKLAKGVDEMTSLLFLNALSVPEVEKIPRSSVNAVLIPRVLFIERALGASAWGESVLSIGIEWRLEDTAGRLIWIDSVVGEGRVETGSGFTHSRNTETQIRLALEDLFGKAVTALRGSVEIAAFSVRPREAR